MKIWKILFIKQFINFNIFFILLFVSLNLHSQEIKIEIIGNKFTDSEVILSLITKKPSELNEEYSNYLLKTLADSKLFEEVSVKLENKSYIINISEYSNINRVYFEKNERFDKEELENFVKEIDLVNLNPLSIKLFISELKKLYGSFGYNDVEITYDYNLNKEMNVADIYFKISEGSITKIKNIYFDGNLNFDDQLLKSIIKSKTKTLINIFANNNFKKFITENDTRLISQFYKNNGYIDIDVKLKIEYLKSNKVNLYFKISEGNIYNIDKIDILDNNKLLNNDILLIVNKKIKDYIEKNKYYSINKIGDLKSEISELIIQSGIDFFEISMLEKKDNNNVSILINIKSIEPLYVNQINIYGNSRTFDYVVRRELLITEGDAVNKSQIAEINKKLQSLRLFKSVKVKEKNIENNLVNIEIEVEEQQTGTVNAGVSVGTIDGFSVVAGLSERNFYGTGRSVDALLNTSDKKTEFTLSTTDRLSYENDVDISYKSSYKEEDFASTSSYKLNTFSLGTGIAYNINSKLSHSIDIKYLLKKYIITDNNTVSSTIGNSAGQNASFIISNGFVQNTLNSIYQPQDGSLTSFITSIESPMSSSNGYVKNVLTIKNFKKFNKNILSNQTRIGNIFSTNNNDILTDDKFSLGGRWLRGFDVAGAGPRNSRTSYIGGNNLFVTKFDYSREIFANSNFPIFLNLFNDYGIVWENKTTPTQSDNNLRASVGFGIKYYSPIGPIGFSWGFPIIEEEYDIKRMFLFSVGNID
tara:strand:- start:2559 stop:4829 length:2271 start_codon:yes stop_codon:yes gene_type:complete